MYCLFDKIFEITNFFPFIVPLTGSSSLPNFKQRKEELESILTNSLFMASSFLRRLLWATFLYGRNVMCGYVNYLDQSPSLWGKTSFISKISLRSSFIKLA
jgi:hypothetical protein